MSRASTSYTATKVASGPVPGAIDVTRPAEGYYRFRLRSGSVFGGVRVWYGAPVDPVTGEELDRSWRWQAMFNGEPIDLDRVWPTCAGDPITEDEYHTYCKRQAWARQHAPKSAFADATRRTDPLSRSTPLPF